MIHSARKKWRYIYVSFQWPLLAHRILYFWMSAIKRFNVLQFYIPLSSHYEYISITEWWLMMSSTEKKKKNVQNMALCFSLMDFPEFVNLQQMHEKVNSICFDRQSTVPQNPKGNVCCRSKLTLQYLFQWFWNYESTTSFCEGYKNWCIETLWI